MHGKGRKSRETVGHTFFLIRASSGEWRLLRLSKDEHMERDNYGSGVRRQGEEFTYRGLETDVLAMQGFRNNRFAFASRQLALVFRGAVGRCGLAAADAHPI